MALQKVVLFRGVEVDAYIRVVLPTINLTKTSINFGLWFFADSTQLEPFDSVSFDGAPYDIDGPNPIAQAYEHVKVLPEFSAAVDC